jgi:hypothetical protein
LSAPTKPTWDEYAAELAKRLARDELPMPGVLALGILGFAAEDDRLPDYVRAECRASLNRLVDEEGNPKDDYGRTALEWAADGNALAHHGSLSYIDRRPEGVDEESIGLIIRVDARVAERKSREAIRPQLVAHAETYVDLLLDELYRPPEELDELPGAAEAARSDK